MGLIKIAENSYNVYIFMTKIIVQNFKTNLYFFVINYLPYRFIVVFKNFKITKFLKFKKKIVKKWQKLRNKIFF